MTSIIALSWSRCLFVLEKVVISFPVIWSKPCFRLDSHVFSVQHCHLILVSRTGVHNPALNCTVSVRICNSLPIFSIRLTCIMKNLSFSTTCIEWQLTHCIPPYALGPNTTALGKFLLKPAARRHCVTTGESMVCDSLSVKHTTGEMYRSFATHID